MHYVILHIIHHTRSSYLMLFIFNTNNDITVMTKLYARKLLILALILCPNICYDKLWVEIRCLVILVTKIINTKTVKFTNKTTGKIQKVPITSENCYLKLIYLWCDQKLKLAQTLCVSIPSECIYLMQNCYKMYFSLDLT